MAAAACVRVAGRLMIGALQVCMQAECNDWERVWVMQAGAATRRM